MDNSNEPEVLPDNKQSVWATVVCGFLMGVADAVPGVSGGTVALILGIYKRLVTAISHFDAQLFSHLKSRNWREAATRIDLYFILTLAVGIATGLLGSVILIHELIEDHHPAKPYVFAAFFGAIVASSYLVVKMIRIDSNAQLAYCIEGGLIGAAFAFWLTGLETLAPVEARPNLFFLFFAGVIAISAMILPGISGSYLLLIFGVYQYLSGIPKAILKGASTLDDFVAFAVFALGCLIGLLSFSRFLRWLLKSYQAITLAVMCGFMIGALRTLWPWAVIESPNYGQSAGLLLTLGLAMTAVLLIDYGIRRLGSGKTSG